MPPMIPCQLAALTIAGIFYVWRDVFQKRVQSYKVLRERVTYMLWVSAQH